MLAHLANMNYIVQQMHARVPLMDRDAEVPITFHMDHAREQLQQSMGHALANNPVESLKSLKQAYTSSFAAVQVMQDELPKQVVRAANGELSMDAVSKNLEDANIAIEHNSNMMSKVRNYMDEEVSKAKSQKELSDNAREIVDKIADDNNLLLPGSWTRGGDEPSPNGE